MKARLQVPKHIFDGSEAFISLLLRQSVRSHAVLARAYSNGSWHQYSGRDFISHLGRASADWKFTALNMGSPNLKSLLYLGTPSYVGWMACLGALCAGFNIMFLPNHASAVELKWCVDHFKVQALVTDSEEFVPFLKTVDLPIFNVSNKVFLPRDRHADPEVFALFRLVAMEEDVRMAREQADFVHLKSLIDWFAERPIGRLQFVSFGHDGEQKPVSLCADALVVTAQNFGIHLCTPQAMHWRSMEMLAVSNAFCHVGRFSVLIKNGVVGFPSATSDWETNLRILRPSLLFGSSAELEQVVNFVESVTHRAQFKGRFKVGGRLEQLRELLSSGRALKLPEQIFDSAGRLLRYVSKKLVGERFLEEALGSLELVIHGLSPAKESHVKCLDRLGVPVVETYGVTAAAGLLSSNTYDAPHLNLVGSPLPHVSFRLGALSLLEYKINLPVFEGHKEWQETGDVAQMTPFGFSISGRKKHLYKTRGGAVVAPARIEQLLCGEDPIEMACLIGDLMPYLVLLVVPTAEALVEYDQEPEALRSKIQERINKVNEALPRNVTIKKFSVLSKPFSDQEGEKLPNGTLNRLRIYESRKSDIQALYEST
jgi:long-chain acyl-CoA synthetase